MRIATPTNESKTRHTRPRNEARLNYWKHINIYVHKPETLNMQIKNDKR